MFKFIKKLFESRESLIGKRVEIIVSEPSEFPKGPFKGTIVASKVSNVEPKQTMVLVEMDTPPQHQGIDYAFLVGSPRHSVNLVFPLGKNVPTAFQRVSSDKAQSESAFDLSAWRGGGGILGDIKILEI